MLKNKTHSHVALHLDLLENKNKNAVYGVFLCRLGCKCLVVWCFYSVMPQFEGENNSS